MSDLKIYDDYNTLPEQVQINKDDIKTNTASIATNTTNIATNTSDITKLQDDISKIKPNAWEERNFNIDIGGSSINLSTFNPITNQSNPIVNIQRSFTDKDTYTLSDAINSYSFAVSGSGIFAYVICADPSLTLEDLLVNELMSTTKNAMVFVNTDVGGNGKYWLLINCKIVNTDSLAFGDPTIFINNISTDDDKSPHSILTAKAVDQYYLKKTDASNTYATMNALKPLQNTYFDADLTTAGLAKIQTNATIGTSITLVKDTDFIENITNTDLAHRTVIFTLYQNDAEEVYISENIKLNIVNTTDYYGDNDQHHIWFTGMGVIKLGSASALGNNYLCYIAYDTTSTRGLMITPVLKLN